MTSFQAIAGSKSTNLAVVAPGIAEALLATAIGLLAAIPAVIAYNKFSSDAGKLAVRMEGFADEFSAILSRQIDEKVAAPEGGVRQRQVDGNVSRSRRGGRGGRGHRRRGRHHAPDVGNQRHAVRRRDAGAADHLHGRGAAADRRRADRPAGDAGQGAELGRPSRSPISVNQGGQIYLQETEIPIDEVVPKLQAIATTGYDERIYVRGDKTADYGTVMQVMARISARRLQQYRPGHAAGTGRADPAMKAGLTTSVIAACGAARLRPVLAVGAEGRSRSPTSRRCRSTSCRSTIDPDPAGRQEGAAERKAGADADQEARRSCRKRKRSATTASIPSKPATPRADADARSQTAAECPKPSPKPDARSRVDEPQARTGQAGRSRSRPPVPATERDAEPPQPEAGGQARPGRRDRSSPSSAEAGGGQAAGQRARAGGAAAAAARPQTAKAPDRKDAEKPVKQA